MKHEKTGEVTFLQQHLGGHFGKVLASLSPHARNAMMANGRIKQVARGEVLLKEGEIPLEIGCVLSGALGMTQIRADGQRHIIGLLTPSHLCGRPFVGPNDYRIEVLAPSELYCFPRDMLEALLKDEPQAENIFLNELLDEIDAARQWLILISGRQVLHRVAAFMALLARRAQIWQEREVVTVELPLSRTNIAELLGTRPETLSRTIHKIADMGVLRIVMPNVFEVFDIAALEEMADQDAVLNDQWPSPARKVVGRRSE